VLDFPIEDWWQAVNPMHANGLAVVLDHADAQVPAGNNGSGFPVLRVGLMLVIDTIGYADRVWNWMLIGEMG